jgi:chromosome segregation ATPase
MVEAPSPDILNSALVPVEELRDEQSQFESSLRESFAELESLHDELAEWQRELTRQQAELDQRAAAVADAEASTGVDGDQACNLRQQLVQAQDEARQLEEENAEQLQTLDDLERQLVAAQTELRAARKHGEELTIALDTERERAIDEHRLWSGELREMRRLLERHGALLASLGAASPPDQEEAADSDSPPEACAEVVDDSPSHEAATRAAELRRRATSRRARRRGR